MIEEDFKILIERTENINKFVLEHENQLFRDYPNNNISIPLSKPLSIPFRKIEKSVDPLYEDGKYSKIVDNYFRAIRILDTFNGVKIDHVFTLNNGHKYEHSVNYYKGTVNFKRIISYDDPTPKE